MTSHYEKLGPCALAVLDSVDYYGDGLIITRINVPAAFRGQGYARALLGRICAEADVKRQKLWLEISPSDGLDYDMLEAWYRRAGFRDVGGIFCRKPRAGRTTKEGESHEA